MTKKNNILKTEPIYCFECESLAFARLENTNLCSACLFKALEATDKPSFSYSDIRPLILNKPSGKSDAVTVVSPPTNAGAKLMTPLINTILA